MTEMGLCWHKALPQVLCCISNLIKDPDNTANCLASVLGENRDELFEN